MPGANVVGFQILGEVCWNGRHSDAFIYIASVSARVIRHRKPTVRILGGVEMKRQSMRPGATSYCLGAQRRSLLARAIAHASDFGQHHPAPEEKKISPEPDSRSAPGRLQGEKAPASQNAARHHRSLLHVWQRTELARTCRRACAERAGSRVSRVSEEGAEEWFWKSAGERPRTVVIRKYLSSLKRAPRVVHKVHS